MAKRYVKFDVVKASVRMEQVLEHYSLVDEHVQHRGDELILHCVFHENDKTPSLKINTAKNVFNCFGCNEGGDILDFVVLREGIATGSSDRDRREAALLLQQWFHLSGKRGATPRSRTTVPPSPASGAGERGETRVPDAAVQEQERARENTDAVAAATVVEPVNPPLQFTFNHLDPNHPYLSARGVTQETIERFGLGYHSGKGMMAGRVVIPIQNEQGEVVAYAGRWPGDPPEGTPKYLFPAKFQKSLVVYNLHRARAHAGDGLIVVEGFFAVFELFQRNRHNVVAIMGSALSAAQEQLIVETVGPKGRCLLAFDPDDAGRTGMHDAAARLVQHIFVRTLALTI